MKNRVKSLRAKLGLTQRALAEMVGTSQQQIQRIEAGKVAARLEVAAKLAEALKSPLTIVFPGSAKPLRKLAKDFEDRRYLHAEDTYSALSDAGIEADVRAWYLKVQLRGHSKSLMFHIAPEEQRRLFPAVQNENARGDGMTFIIFDTQEERVAINAKELVYCHFLFETAAFVREESEEPPMQAVVLLAGNPCVLTFGVDPDDGDADDEEDEGQFRSIFFSMELSPEETDRFHFVDEDGEDVFLRGGDVALLRVPLSVVDPDYEWDHVEEEVIHELPDATPGEGVTPSRPA